MELVGELLGLGVPPEFVPPSHDCALRLATSMRRQPADPLMTPGPVQRYPPDSPTKPAPHPAPGMASLLDEPLQHAREAGPDRRNGRQRRRKA